MGCYDKGMMGRLAPPRRNHYFHGKLLAAAHFLQEQNYFNQQRYLLNRLGTGFGVLCGLVSRPSDGQICVSPGVALDRYGREITLPERVCLDPWQLTDDCGRPGEVLPQKGPHDLTLCLAYAECPADFMPVLVSDCPPYEECAPGSIVESYALIVRRGQPAELGGIDPVVCRELFGSARSAADRRQLLSEAMLADCAELPGETCVPLAHIQLEGNQIVSVKAYTVRPRVYSNTVLLELILCLADRLDECCGDPHPVTILLDPEALPEGTVGLSYTNQLITASGGQAPYAFVLTGALPDGLSLATAGPSSSTISGTPTAKGTFPFTVQATDAYGDTGQRNYQIVINPGPTVTITLQPAKLPNGTVGQEYGQLIAQQITASGGTAPYAFASPPGALPGGLALATDGTISGIPTTPGIFPFTVRATDFYGATGKKNYRIVIDQPQAPQVARLSFIDVNNIELAILTVGVGGGFFDPLATSTVVHLQEKNNIHRIAVRFINAVDPSTLVSLPGDDPDTLGWLLRFDPAGSMTHVPCTVKPDPRVQNQFLFEVDPSFKRFTLAGVEYGILREGLYRLGLFGDPSGKHKIVAASDGTPLDGESTQLPSGDTQPGGNFDVDFKI